MAYGVATTNVYELLGDSEGPEDAPPVIKVPESKKKDAPSKPADTGKGDAAAGKPVAAGVEARLRGQAPPEGGRGRGRGRGSPRGGRGGGRTEDRAPREDFATDASDAMNGPSPRGRGGRRGGGGRGRGRGEDFNGRQRQYDRHDASGRGYEPEKRHGAGKGNWGAEGEEVAEVEKTPAPEEAPAPAGEGDAPAAGEDTAAAEAVVDAEPEVAKEPEKEEMTLEEYEAKIAEKRGALRKQPASRPSNDQSLEKDFAGMKAFERKNAEDDNALELQNKKIIGNRKAGTVDKGRKEKEVVPTGFHVVDDSSPRPFGGRGRGRGRGDMDRGERGTPREAGGGDRPFFGRGRGPRGEGRGGRGGARNGPTPNFDDAAAFPTLGGT